MGRLAAGAALLLVSALAGCGFPATPAASSSSSRSSPPTTTAAAPALADAPTVLSLPIALAEQKNGITIDAVDLGQRIVDGVDHQRAIFDLSNWRLVAQCDQMVGTTLKAGAIKNGEFLTASSAGQAGKFADNSLKGLLTCP